MLFSVYGRIYLEKITNSNKNIFISTPNIFLVAARGVNNEYNRWNINK